MSKKCRIGLLPISITLSFMISIVARYVSEAFLHNRIAVIGSFIGLQPIENAGVAFGLHLPVVLQEILIASVLMFFVYIAIQERHRRIPSISFGLIIGGALANIIDRFDNGTVTDFFQIGSFPVFNVADSCITIGAVLLLLNEYLVHRAKKKLSV